jgi:NAD(P)H-flavin reductase
VVSSQAWSYLKSFLIHPATFGKHHRKPVAGGLVPTRGQTLYILLISFLNIILLIAPYTIKQPQASFTTSGKQLLSIIGNRAGTMAMGNVVVLFLFSSRNSFLLYLTDWSYSTYLLLHRWLGYWAVIHTVIHSSMLWSYYVKAGTYSAEKMRLYWIWGIVGTVSICALVPFSLLKIRQKFYEFFIVSHVTFSLLFLIGYYYHIWYVYTYNWGYEIWMFVAAGIWALERLSRIARMVFQGGRTAIVSVLLDTDDEYIRIDVNGKAVKSGVAYLCFPTLSWRFWETHPFSICGSISNLAEGPSHPSQLKPGSKMSHGPDTNHEKDAAMHTITSAVGSDIETQGCNATTTFFARTRSGVTKALKTRASGSEVKQVRLRVMIDGPYNHSGRVHSQLAQCSSILCIAGGVGITACLPFLKQNKGKDTKLFWSSRKSGLVTHLTPTLNGFPSNVKVETLIGQRFDLNPIIHRELTDHDGTSKGPLAIIVSGPPGLADDVRLQVTQVAKSCRHSRAYVLVDEAFSW